MKKDSKNKRTRRSRTKYPALKAQYNTKVRQDYIEPDYVNGVVNAKGEQVIRPLNDDEKKWLNKFYEEFIVASFKKDGSDLHSQDEKRKEIYRQNNKRNSCLYNQKSAEKRLKSLDTIGYDRFIAEKYGHLDWELVLIDTIKKMNEEDN